MEDKQPRAKPQKHRRKLKSPDSLTGADLLRLAERYILECTGGSAVSGQADSDDQDGEQKLRGRTQKREGEKTRFPNLAGFCRYLGIGTEKYAELEAKYRDETGLISAAFEDEALNSGMAATLLSAYLKKRLGYEVAPQKCDSTANGEIKVVFEHDILADGE